MGLTWVENLKMITKNFKTNARIMVMSPRTTTSLTYVALIHGKLNPLHAPLPSTNLKKNAATGK